MPVLRLSPGEAAPWEGTYALVGHYGEPLGFALRRNAGEPLPLVAIGVSHEPPLWWHMIDAEAAQAAA